MTIADSVPNAQPFQSASPYAASSAPAFLKFAKSEQHEWSTVVTLVFQSFGAALLCVVSVLDDLWAGAHVHLAEAIPRYATR